MVNDVQYVVGGLTSTKSIAVPNAANEKYLPIGYGTPDPSYVLEHSDGRSISSHCYYWHSGLP